MFCKHCGKEIENGACFCASCGAPIDMQEKNTFTYAQPQYNYVPVNNKYNESKSGIGFLMAFFLGLIGLVIGLCIYPNDTIARKTFVKAWVITFAVTIVASIILCFIFFGVLVGLAGPYYNYY